jgi:hypothetical protein
MHDCLFFAWNPGYGTRTEELGARPRQHPFFRLEIS